MTPAADDRGPAPPAAPVPGLWRRLACFTYEGVLLFGVVMIAGYLFSTLTQQRHALTGRHGLQAFLFIVLGIYFVWFWSHGGQTVAMRAWHIRLVDRAGAPVTQPRAFVRYLLSWLWFMPALTLTWLSGLTGGGPVFGVLAVGVVTYALSSRLHPDRQFLHDALAGTRLVTHRPERPPPTLTERRPLPGRPAGRPRHNRLPMSNPHKGRTGLDRLVRATGHSMNGLQVAYREENAFLQEVWVAAALLPLAFWLGRSWVEIALLAGSVWLVLIVELLNSGIESAIDRVSFELHDLSRRAKDLASAAVFLSLVMCGAIWAAALWHRFA